MAKPAKRRVEGTGAASRSGSGSTSTDASGSSATSKRVTPKADQRAGGRYTPPRTGAVKGPSPRWVPVLMFGLWALGLLVIILNYMGVLPGSSDGGNGWYLVAGLASILGGIMVATQYR
ncbi:cell division protein CrgA [Dermatobacter hominis]|uniref:cell division protein CrgA n=1 Tax=Dermatobacter hominis TaxID=2884263 RepID=UPI001D116DAD|nr:cell division protein CrgA [Dermatobacter hominis]UDY34241.1 cell division protein CrgA [Dermatobacter hominis]